MFLKICVSFCVSIPVGMNYWLVLQKKFEELSFPCLDSHKEISLHYTFAPRQGKDKFFIALC
jgi:hypothetical protein